MNHIPAIPAIKDLLGLLLDVVLLPVRVGSYERINDRGSMTDFDFGAILVLPIFVGPILLTLAASGLFLPWGAKAILVAGLYAFSPAVRLAIVGSQFAFEFAKDKFILRFNAEQVKMIGKENDSK